MSPAEPSATPSASRWLDVGACWRADTATAQTDLEATPTQARVVAAHALAWRSAAFTLPVALAVAAWLVASREARPMALLIAAGLGALGPQLLASLLTLPAQWRATFQAWSGGSRATQVRFGLLSLVYPYYGWRYAYRGRRRPWGALTREERVRVDPERAGGAPTSSHP